MVIKSILQVISTTNLNLMLQTHSRDFMKFSTKIYLKTYMLHYNKSSKSTSVFK